MFWDCLMGYCSDCCVCFVICGYGIFQRFDLLGGLSERWVKALEGGIECEV